MMLAIKEAVVDMSPFVRKTAANAISKLYSLDPDLKEDLIAIIEKLLADKTIVIIILFIHFGGTLIFNFSMLTILG